MSLGVDQAADIMWRKPDAYLRATWRTLSRHRNDGQLCRPDALRLLRRNVRDFDRDNQWWLTGAERDAIAGKLFDRWLDKPTSPSAYAGSHNAKE